MKKGRKDKTGLASTKTVQKSKMITIQTYEITMGLFLGKARYLSHGHAKIVGICKLGKKRVIKLIFEGITETYINNFTKMMVCN